MTVDPAQLTYAHAVAYRPVVETVRTFLAAQKIDVSVAAFATHMSHVSADDDDSLVNAYVTIDGSMDELVVDDLVAYLDSPRIDPARTDVIIPDPFAPLEQRLRRLTYGKVRRVVRASEFLDGHLRPKNICDDLLSNKSLLSIDDFVDQRAQVEGADDPVYASEYLFNQWVGGTAPRLCMVLAPAGYGKSKVTHILARKMAANYKMSTDMPNSTPVMRPPVPILLAFGDYPSFTSFAGVILEALNKHGKTRLTVEAFQYLISLGRAVFILDGYDEMMESNQDRARHNVTDFIQQAGPESRILLTSRSVFYRTASDVIGQVGDPLLGESAVGILELQPFNKKQARRYLNKRLSGISGQNRLLERAQDMLENDETMSILGSPIFLAEFANEVREDKWSIKDVRQHGGLEFLVKRAFARERTRQKHEFSDEQQRAFLEGFAFDMMNTGVAGYTRDELEILIAETIDNDLLLANWRDLTTHHFLAPTTGRSNALITMKHQVWRDYFQGTALAKELVNRTTRVSSLIEARDLPEGVLRAAAKNLPEAAWDWLLASVASNDSDKRVRNLLKLHLLRAGDLEEIILPDELALSLEGRNLSGLSFSRVDFGDANFAKADLTGTYFDRCDLSECALREAVLSSTVFRSCHLSKNITEAEIASVQIDSEVLYEPQIEARFGIASEAAEDRPVVQEMYEQTVREWATDILRSRLEKFLKRMVGENNFAVDDSISWIAFIGGTKPKERDFVVRRLYRALQAENVVTSGKLTANGRPTILLSGDQQVRSELVRFVNDRIAGPTIESVIDRLIK